MKTESVKCRQETEFKAREFCKFLNSSGYAATVDPQGFRDYLARIDVFKANQDLGKLALYYSPKKKRYTLQTTQIPAKSFAGMLEDLWNEFNGFPISPALLNSPEKNIIKAYVDGSYMKEKIGYGAVLIKDNTIVAELSGKVDSIYNEHRQIAGELKSVLETVNYCKKNSIEKISIYYDYLGIEKWARGQWKAKKKLTKLYQEYMKKQSLTIYWHKVSAHSGNKWNDHADQLAKESAMKKK